MFLARLGVGILKHLVVFARQTFPCLRQLAGVLLGLRLHGAGIGHHGFGLRAPARDDRLYGLVEKALQQPDQDQKVDGLQRQRPPVDVHFRSRSASAHKGIGEQHQQRDHETVDRHGLDHGQADKQGA